MLVSLTAWTVTLSIALVRTSLPLAPYLSGACRITRSVVLSGITLSGLAAYWVALEIVAGMAVGVVVGAGRDE